jgi:hypothetical protein
MNLKESRMMVYNFIQALAALMDDLKNEVSEEKWNIWYVFSTILDIQDLVTKTIQKIKKLRVP